MASVQQLLTDKTHKQTLTKEVSIRTQLQAGDLGAVTYLHGLLYHQEYQYDMGFEAYVAAGLQEFYQQYDPATNRVWICEHYGRMIGFLLLMNRGSAAQLRYFLLLPEYRGIGLGKQLMERYMAFLKECGYQSSYLWTTHELQAAAYLYQSYGFKLTQQKESLAFGKPLLEQRYDLLLDETIE
jgi:peptidyl-dipeptidase Dcp